MTVGIDPPFQRRTPTVTPSDELLVVKVTLAALNATDLPLAVTRRWVEFF
ncbi:hypothetical protein LWC34_00670 [Kibdelosporangium philippinense]|uniref:Alcohol dehydrogenase n=1 Tax=Kibdelosporangium philippinense TaxID=211113 RepID=A0ABS8Z369_9PSEU|nr:hypothetical protein [Kibdelosporangium philippinense]MCE7001359.1 hypothetical protein [Kibdelosporangium philippinense]